MVHPDQKDWCNKIPLTEFAINSNISSSTGFAPFELNYGYIPSLINGIKPQESAHPGVRQFAERAINNMQIVHDAIIESRVVQTYQANRLRRRVDPYAIGDRVSVATVFSRIF